jgi:hypothetical protein
LTFEIARRDEEILLRIRGALPYTSSLGRRTRTTNFKAEYETSILSVFDRDFRERFIEWGMPIGRKSHEVAPPRVPFAEFDYVRGLLDGDGSVGVTELGFPFVSLNTTSDAIAAFYVDFLHRVTGRPRKTTSRNARDDAYNIAVFKELAQAVISPVYYDGALALTRKKSAARTALDWRRPVGVRGPYIARRWTARDDEYALTHSVEQSMRALDRTRASVSMRLWRLRN